jgi:hypothetical protein
MNEPETIRSTLAGSKTIAVIGLSAYPAKPFLWGTGQNLLREALLIADHTAYHTGEHIILRRLLGAWPK